jgi:hypothetical protein
MPENYAKTWICFAYQELLVALARALVTHLYGKNVLSKSKNK